MIKLILYRLFQLFVTLPVMIVTTVVCGLVTVLGSWLGSSRWWGYWPPHIWARICLAVSLVRVKVTGRENIDPETSYVFVANHQGAYDIFTVYGYLNHNFKWMMKHQLRSMPFVGFACEKAHHIFVDRRGPKKIKETYDKARATLTDGMSLMVFPEGARTFTGHMGVFRRGAFMLADELQLPVVPLTINGSFDIMPRTKDWHWVSWHPLTLTIHKPIYPLTQGTENIRRTMDKSYEDIMSALPEEYRGFVENPDQ